MDIAFDPRTAGRSKSADDFLRNTGGSGNAVEIQYWCRLGSRLVKPTVVVTNQPSVSSFQSIRNRLGTSVNTGRESFKYHN